MNQEDTNPTITKALEEFLQLMETGLTCDNVHNYLTRWEKNQGSEFRKDLFTHLKVYSEARQYLRMDKTRGI